VWRRGTGTIVILHHGDGPVDVPAPSGKVLIATDRDRDGEPVDGTLRLRPWEALILDEVG
jgi:hypothetical protein